jgi:phosphate butyryltransferase
VFCNFDEIKKHLQNKGISRRIALCGAHDDAALGAVVKAKREGLITSTLIGNEDGIKQILSSLNEPAGDYEIIHETDEKKSARLAMTHVHEGNADIPMKGLMQTQSFLAALFNPLIGILKPNEIMSHVTVFYYPNRNRFVFATDTSIVLNPSLESIPSPIIG